MSGIGSATLLAAAVVLAPSCSDQPKVRCAAARGMFAAKYTLVSGTGDCSLLPGEILGVGSYNGSNSDGTPNWDDASIAIQPASLGALAASAGDTNFSLGHITTATPSDANFCDVPTLSVAEVHVAAVTTAMVNADGTVTCPSPALDVKYEWSNVRLVVSAAVLGTELAGDLTYTNNGCTATYRVWAVSPAVSCQGAIPPPPVEDAGTDDAGDAASDASPDVSVTSDAGASDGATDARAISSDASGGDGAASDAGAAANDAAAGDGGGGALPPECLPGSGGATPAPMVDLTLCSPYPNVEKNRPLGSGLNPDLFPDGITCDPATFLCVLTRDPTR